MKHALIVALISSCLSGFSSRAEEAPAPVVAKLIATTYGGDNLHRVSSDGKIVPFKMPAGTRWDGGGPEGSSDPAPSPDGKQLAFIQKGSLLIRPMEGGKAVTVVSGYVHEMLYITGWSPDGSQLVYFLGPPQADDAPPSKITESKHFLYDVKAKTKREITLDGSLVGWLPNGEMLIHNTEHGTLSSLSLARGAKPKQLLKEEDELGQIELSPDGKRIAVSRNKRNDTSNSQLVAIELDGGKSTPISKPGEWAEFQWPKWSPSGKRTAWIARVGMVEGQPNSVLVVDGKILTKPGPLSDFLWLSETTIAMVELEALAVLDLATGKELGRKVTAKNVK